MVLSMMRESCTVPSRPVITQMNNMSNEKAAKTFCMHSPFLPLKGTWFAMGITAFTSVSSIAPTQP